MASVTSRVGGPSTGSPAPSTRSGAVGPAGFSDGYRQGFLAALTVAALGLLLSSVLTLIAWATAPHDEAGVSTALRTAGRLWLSIHGVGLSTWVGTVEVVPLGGSMLSGALLFLAVSRAARSADATFFRPRRLVGLTGGLLGGYCLSAFTVAVLGGSGFEAAVSAAWGAAVLSGSALVLGLLRAERVGAGSLSGLPAGVRRSLVGAVGGVAILLAGGALLAVGMVIAGTSDIATATASLRAGGTGNVLLLLTQILYAPVLVVWGAAVAVGPGFGLGPGSVQLSGSSITETPVVPLLSALPTTGPLPTVSWLAIAVPVLAGVLCAVIAAREAPSLPSALRRSGGAGALTGVVLGALCLPASGSLAPGFYNQIGPNAITVGIATVLEVGAAALVMAALLTWRTSRDVVDARA